MGILDNAHMRSLWAVVEHRRVASWTCLHLFRDLLTFDRASFSLTLIYTMLYAVQYT